MITDDMLERPLAPGATDSAARGQAGAGSGLARVLGLVRRWRAMLIAAAVMGGVAGFAVASAGTPTYETRAVLLVGPINTDLDTLRAAGQLAQTYAQLATSGPILQATGQRLRLRNLSGSISASANEVTRLLTIRVRDHDAARGARIANAHADELVALATRRNSSRTPGPGELQVVDRAQATTTPSGPGAGPIAIVGAIAGLLGALGIALLFDRSGDALRGAGDVGGLTGGACLSLLGRRAWSAPARPPIVERNPVSTPADELRLLAAKVQAVADRSVAVMRLDPGPSGLAGQLAGALAEGGARVALLDLDAGRATLIAADRVPEPLDLPELAGIGTVEEARALLNGLREADDADLTLIDLPSIERSFKGVVWSRAAEMTLLTAQVDRTPRRSLAAVAESLRLIDARLLGTVIGAPPGLLGSRPAWARRASGNGRPHG
jgi:capsular polysaccharide biosynthesis protein